MIFSGFYSSSLVIKIFVFFCFSENFSIFVYGLGSKKLLINEFQEQYISDFDHLVINGFFPSLTLKSVSSFKDFIYSGFMQFMPH